MALFRSAFGVVVTIGVGVVAVAAIIAAPSLLRAARPAAREAIRRGLNAYERARAATAELAEDVEDIVAEVRAERDAAKTAPATSDRV